LSTAQRAGLFGNRDCALFTLEISHQPPLYSQGSV
jgi:hypothetical protein